MSYIRTELEIEMSCIKTEMSGKGKKSNQEILDMKIDFLAPNNPLTVQLHQGNLKMLLLHLPFISFCVLHA